MITNYLMTTGSINVITDSGVKIVSNDHKKFDEIKEALFTGKFDEAEAMIDPSTGINMSNSGFEVKNGVAYVNGEQVPSVLSNRLVEFHELDEDYSPLLNFWHKLKANPSNRAINELYGFLESCHCALAEDGDFYAYKRIRSDFTDLYTGDMDNSIGATVAMDRRSVDDNPNHTCSHGLHVAAYKYAATSYGAFGTLENGDRLVMVKVNPKNVVSIPVDYDNTKMRVCEYTVVREIDREVKDQVYRDPSASSFNDHADPTDFYSDDDFELTVDDVFENETYSFVKRFDSRGRLLIPSDFLRTVWKGKDSGVLLVYRCLHTDSLHVINPKDVELKKDIDTLIQQGDMKYVTRYEGSVDNSVRLASSLFDVGRTTDAVVVQVEHANGAVSLKVSQ